MEEKTTVIFNHDAAIDEYMAMVLLTTMKDVDLLGTVITNADCIAGPAMDTAWKIQSYINRQDIPLTLSNARGWNPFPWSYRSDCIKQGNIDCLKPYGPNLEWPPYPSGEEFLKNSLNDAVQAKTKLTLLVNCPLTTLRNVLRKDRELEHGIERLIWMGGAIGIMGNLDPATIPYQVANFGAEWNAFWDPGAVHWILKKTRFPIIQFPLNATNEAAISQEFMDELFAQSQEHRYSKLALESYTLVDTEAFYDMWDVLTTCYIPHPGFFEMEPMQIAVETEGFDQGTIRKVKNGGREVTVAMGIKKKRKKDFYDYVLKQFKRS